MSAESRGLLMRQYLRLNRFLSNATIVLREQRRISYEETFSVYYLQLILLMGENGSEKLLRLFVSYSG